MQYALIHDANPQAMQRYPKQDLRLLPSVASKSPTRSSGQAPNAMLFYIQIVLVVIVVIADG